MKNPQITSPDLIYKAVQQIQNLLATLSFVEYSFGICEVRQHEGRTIPTVYQGESLDEYNVSPTDAMKSYCFWDKYEAEVSYPDDRINSKMKYSHLSYNVAIIFYTFDVRELGLTTDIRNAKTEIFKEFIKILERGLLTAQSDFQITNIIDRTPQDAFKGFTVENLNQPEYALRIEGILSFNESCY